MCLRLALLLAGGLLLAALGLRPDALPFFRGESRYSDAVTAHWPNALFLRQSVFEHGLFPLWRETTMAGQPFAANPLNKTSYPFQWLVLLLPPTLHLNVMIVFHLLLAGWGMARWLRLSGLREEAALFGAVTYTLAPRMFGHLGAGHLDVIYALAWWPWLMGAIRQTTGGTRGGFIQVALFAALLFLADVRVALFAFMTAFVYALLELNRAKAWGRLRNLTVSAFIFLLLTAGLVIPLLFWQPYLSRDGLTPADAGVFSLEPAHLLGLMLPPRPAGIETLTYTGLPVLALAGMYVLSLKRRSKLIATGVFVLIVLYGLGMNSFLWPLLVKLFPLLLWFRVPSRIWLVLVLLMPVMAAYGLNWLLDLHERHSDNPKLPGLRLTTAAFAALCIALGLFALFALSISPAVGLTTLFVGGGTGILLLLTLNGRIHRASLAALFIGLVFLDLAVIAYGWAEWRSEAYWLEPHRPLAERLLAENPARIYSPTYSLEQQVAEVYGLRLFGGVDPFQLQGFVDAVEQGSGVPVEGYSVVLPPVRDVNGDDLSTANRDAAINTRVLAEWDVSHVAAAYPIGNSRLQYVDEVNGVYIYANQDYTPSDQSASVPAWPADWNGLPDQLMVARLNALTLTTWLVSGTSFLICVCLVLLLKRKART